MASNATAAHPPAWLDASSQTFLVFLAAVIVAPVFYPTLQWLEQAAGGRPTDGDAADVGLVEPALYIGALIIGKPIFIGFWLLLKAASRWRQGGSAEMAASLVDSGLVLVAAVLSLLVVRNILVHFAGFPVVGNLP